MRKTLWAIPLAATLTLTACTGGGDDPSPMPTVTATEPQSTVAATPNDSPSSQSEASIDVDSGGEPSADAQDASGEASLGTAVATVSIQLPGKWQYEGTYGNGVLPYAVLVDASQPFDLSQPGSAAYKDSVWVQVETYRVGEDSPYGDSVPDNASAFADQVAGAKHGDGETFTAGEIPIVHVSYTNEDGVATDDLLALHGGIWILARPTNVDVGAYLDSLRDGDADDGILHAVLESSTIK